MPAVIIDQITRTWITNDITLGSSQKHPTRSTQSDTHPSPASGAALWASTTSVPPLCRPNISRHSLGLLLVPCPPSLPSFLSPALCTRSIAFFHIDTFASTLLPAAGPDTCLLFDLHHFALLFSSFLFDLASFVLGSRGASCSPVSTHLVVWEHT